MKGIRGHEGKHRASVFVTNKKNLYFCHSVQDIAAVTGPNIYTYFYVKYYVKDKTACRSDI